ncbi:MAG: hypothetical protein PHE25_00300 [Candidatus Gracilibacteria bacterium]|nr:hypothetical protein [Candidatus Gracilibacteria bacterium]
MVNKIKYIIFGFLLSVHSQIFATDAGILGSKSVSDLRNGNIHSEDIPKMISYAIDFLMGIAGTISVIFIIIGSYKIALGTLEGDKSKGKETIFHAIAGFVLAALSWMIMKLVIDNFS